VHHRRGKDKGQSRQRDVAGDADDAAAFNKTARKKAREPGSRAFYAPAPL
jgi:hypothetical protein